MKLQLQNAFSVQKIGVEEANIDNSVEQGTSTTTATDKVPPIANSNNSAYPKNIYHPSFSITSSSIPVSTNMTQKEHMAMQASLESTNGQSKNNIHFVQIKKPKPSKMHISGKEDNMRSDVSFGNITNWH